MNDPQGRCVKFIISGGRGRGACPCVLCRTVYRVRERSTTRTTTLWDLCGCGIVWAHPSPRCLVRAGGAAYARRPTRQPPTCTPPFYTLQASESHCPCAIAGAST
jgi:hypothetical protein